MRSAPFAHTGHKSSIYARQCGHCNGSTTPHNAPSLTVSSITTEKGPVPQDCNERKTYGHGGGALKEVRDRRVRETQYRFAAVQLQPQARNTMGHVYRRRPCSSWQAAAEGYFRVTRKYKNWNVGRNGAATPHCALAWQCLPNMRSVLLSH